MIQYWARTFFNFKKEGVQLLTLCALCFYSSLAFGNRSLGLADWHRTEAYYKDCQNLKEVVVKDKYDVECYTNYHHFNSSAVSKFYKEENARGKFVEIGAFNLWHPGSRISHFKDYKIIAKIMNGQDIVSAMELLPVISDDQSNNERVAKFISETELQLQELYKKSSDESQEKIKELEGELSRAKNLYRSPGYLKVLDALIQLDPSWSLILSPSGEAADVNYTHELVGFFYRSSKVKPVINEHCDRFKKKSHGVSFACYPNLTKRWFGKSIRQVFSRRPFMGSFQSGSFDFTLLTSHIVFNSPSDQEGMEAVLLPSFGVKDYKEIGTGANKANFARWAEMKVILEMMNKIRAESVEKDLIFVGDTNLEASNEQWTSVLSSFSGSKLFVDEPTTLSPKRFLSSGEETNGVASDYDHVILDLAETSECSKDNGDLSARVGNFLKGNIRKVIDNEYRYRMRGTNNVDHAQEEARKKKVSHYTNVLENKLTIKRDTITVDETNIEEKVETFDDRIFQQQLEDDSYYRYFREVVSDHFPVYFSCKA